MDVNPTQVIEKKGSTVLIDCTTSGTTKAVTVTWSLNGAPVETTEERKILANNTLYITNLRSTYKGRYACEAKIDLEGTKTAFADVDIAGKVDFF